MSQHHRRTSNIGKRARKAVVTVGTAIILALAGLGASAAVAEAKANPVKAAPTANSVK